MYQLQTYKWPYLVASARLNYHKKVLELALISALTFYLWSQIHVSHNNLLRRHFYLMLPVFTVFLKVLWVVLSMVLGCQTRVRLCELMSLSTVSTCGHSQSDLLDHWYLRLAEPVAMCVTKRMNTHWRYKPMKNQIPNKSC